MSHYTFTIPSRVYSGPGSIKELPQLIEQLGAKKPLIMTDNILYEAGVAKRVQEQIEGCMVYKDVKPDPSSAHVAVALDYLKEVQADAIIAVGGGSVIDVAKLSSILFKNTASLKDYADNWDLIASKGIPLITVPTTVGSGSEMTRGAVFVDEETKEKKVIISNYLAANFTVLDPELLNTLPSGVTAATGADALTQAIEGVISTNSNAFTDGLHLNAIRLIWKSLPAAVKDSGNVEAMGNMQQAAAMVGSAMAYSGVGAVHAIANVLGGHFHIPHGVACAILLLPVLEFNAKHALNRYRLVGEAMGLKTIGLTDEEVANDVIDHVRELMKEIGFNRNLSEFGIKLNHVDDLAIEAQKHSDMVSNPCEPTVEQVKQLILQAL